MTFAIVARFREHEQGYVALSESERRENGYKMSQLPLEQQDKEIATDHAVRGRRSFGPNTTSVVSARICPGFRYSPLAKAGRMIN